MTKKIIKALGVMVAMHFAYTLGGFNEWRAHQDEDGEPVELTEEEVAKIEEALAPVVDILKGKAEACTRK